MSEDKHQSVQNYTTDQTHADQESKSDAHGTRCICSKQITEDAPACHHRCIHCNKMLKKETPSYLCWCQYTKW